MKRQNGFTLSELLVVMAIVAILLGIGVPSYRYITSSYRLSAEINSLSGDLQLSRSEALKQGQTVVVCASNDGLTCANAVVWNKGWIVFIDLNSNGTVDAGESLLKVQGAFSGNTPDTFTLTNAVTKVSFNREGFATTSAGFASTTFKLVDGASGNPTYTRCLILNPVGMVQIKNHVADPVNCS